MTSIGNEPAEPQDHSPERSDAESPEAVDQRIVEAVLSTVQFEFSGPLPPPDVLAHYNDALPGGADRVLRFAERQSGHRQRLENRGQIFLFIFATVALVGGVVLIAVGQSAEGLIPLLSAIGGLGGLFVYREVLGHRLGKALERRPPQR